MLVCRGHTKFFGGDAERGLGLIVRHYPLIEGEQGLSKVPWYRVPQLLAGSIPLDLLEYDDDPTDATANEMLKFGILTEDIATLEGACVKYIGDKPNQMSEHVYTSRQARFVLRALNGEGAEDLLPEYEEYTRGHSPSARYFAQDPLFAFAVPVYACQLARLCGDAKRATKLLQDAERMRQNVPPTITPFLWTRIVHFNNALQLIPAATRSASLASLRGLANDFFVSGFKGGYGFMRRYLSHIPSR